ncbi:MAG: hypothetical protein WCC84_17730 [Candidatus Cybelea sp.]
MGLKDILALIDRRTFGTASVVLAMFTVIVLTIFFFTKNTFLDWLINDVYNVSGNIEKRVAKDLSVGYGRTFVFDDYTNDSTTREVPQTLLFTLAPTQEAEILLNSTIAKTTGVARGIPIKVTIDSIPVVFPAGTRLTVPFPNGNKPIFEKISPNSVSLEQYPGHAHALSVTTLAHAGEKALITVDALVVVTGPIPTSGQ